MAVGLKSNGQRVIDASCEVVYSYFAWGVVLTSARNVSLILALCLAACGGQAAGRHHIGAPPGEKAVSILILDPAGRLFDMNNEPDLFLVAHGEVTRLHTWSDGSLPTIDPLPPPGTRLLVVAQGCRPQLTELTPGRTVVRLEAGFRMRLSIGGERPTLPKPVTLGLSLARRVQELEGVTLPSSLVLRAVAAAVFDEDMPWHPQFVSIPDAGVFDVLIPTPGRYDLEWDLRAGNHASSSNDNRGPFALGPDVDALDITWAKEDIERTAQRLRRNR